MSKSCTNASKTSRGLGKRNGILYKCAPNDHTSKNIIKTKIFNKSSNYKSLDNKFDLNQYEENLINNLLDDIWQDIEITMHSLEFARIMNGEAELTLTSSS